MREIATKKLVVSALKELSIRLDEWVTTLRQMGLNTAEIDQMKKRNLIGKRLSQAAKWTDIRNVSFHFGDVLETPKALVRVYDDIDSWDNAKINAVFTAAVDYGSFIAKQLPV